jgi:hypothetical protein
MRKALALSFIVTVLGVLAYFFKPSEEACIKKAREEFFKSTAYTVDSAPQEIDKNVFAQLLEKNFLQGLEVDDKVLYRNIYQKKAGEKEKIGWGAFGYISVDIK